MRGSSKQNKKVEEEQIVQEFPRRCPYCEKVIFYENIELREGENEIECPSCKRKYILMIGRQKVKGKNVRE